MIIVSGMRATGKLHIGNLVTLKEWVDIQEKTPFNFFLWQIGTH